MDNIVIRFALFLVGIAVACMAIMAVVLKMMQLVLD